MCVFPSWQISGAWCSLFCKSFLWRKGGTTWQHQARTNFTAIACSVRESPCGWSSFSSPRAIPDEGKVIGMHVPPHPSSQLLCFRKGGQEPLKSAVLGLPRERKLTRGQDPPLPWSSFYICWILPVHEQAAIFLCPQLGWGNWHVSGWSRSFPLIVEMWW